MTGDSANAGLPAIALRFDRGTLVLDLRVPAHPHGRPSASLPSDVGEVLAGLGFLPDPRIGDRLRAPARAYRMALVTLTRAGFEVRDEARQYLELTLTQARPREAYPHQQEALAAWLAGGKRGVVVLPTGAGKSYVAELAILAVQRSTLVVAPTIDLTNQWAGILATAFGADLVGVVGGGSFDVKPLTAATYDSAHLHIETLGARFGLVVFDECHHLPSAAYALSAEGSIAPFRLGLTATPERADGADQRLVELVGKTVYRRDIQDLRGLYLASYNVVRRQVELAPEERVAYDEARATYRGFVEAHGVRMSSPGGWQQFLMLASRSTEGRAAFAAWRAQRRIALQSRAKLEVLEALLATHSGDPMLIFTADTDTVYRISRNYLIPALTHETPGPERKRLIEAFNAGRLRALVTARVLNEGVDLPSAQVGVVLAGSATVREHVQRLGRLLRKHGDKEAILYEVITTGTGEESVSERRREHGAYR